MGTAAVWSAGSTRRTVAALHSGRSEHRKKPFQINTFAIRTDRCFAAHEQDLYFLLALLAVELV